MGYKGREMSLAATKFVLGDVNTEPEKEALRYQIGALGSIDDTNTTYTHSLSGTDLILSGSDATTDVVDLSGLGGGGNPFDQDLNTTNFPTFGTLNLTGETLAMNGINTLRIPDQGSLEYHGSLYVGGGGTSASNSSGFQGQYNTGVGIDSLKSVTTGWSNLGLGTFSLENLITGIENNACGYAALRNITTADFNTASGSHALRHITTTDGNTALGYYAGRYIGGGAVSNTISSNSLYLGRETKALVDGGNNEIVIGYDVTGNGSNTITLGNAAITDTYLKGKVTLDSIFNQRTETAANATTTEYPIDGDMGLHLNTSLSSVDLWANNNGVMEQVSGGGGGNPFDQDLNIADSPEFLALTIQDWIHVVGDNTSMGQDALQLSTESFNTAFGYQTLKQSSTGENNTAFGSLSLQANTVGDSNIGVGFRALYNNISGNYNVGIGFDTLYNNTVGTDNIGIGYNAGKSITSAISNTFIGSLAGVNNTATGITGIGANVLTSNTTGQFNTAVGRYALADSTTGNYNTAVGVEAARKDVSTGDNTAFGYRAGYSNLIGTNNANLGSYSAHFSEGSNTTAIGHNSLGRIVSGDNNTALGRYAGHWRGSGTSTLTSADECIFIGSQSRAKTFTPTNEIVIGYDAVGNGSNTITLGNDSVTDTHLKGIITLTGDRIETPSTSIFVGLNAGLFNTGASNTGIGFVALNVNTTGDFNTSIGSSALSLNVTGDGNTACGSSALSNNLADFNSAFGYLALQNNTTGINNSAFGNVAGGGNVTASDVSAFGHRALAASTGSGNTAFGSLSSTKNTTGANNCSFGFGALNDNLTGGTNSAFGRAALGKTTGTGNCGVGYLSLGSNTTGTDNVSIGQFSGYYIANGSTANQFSTDSIYIGAFVRSASNTTDNEVVIGHTAVGNGSDTVTLGNNSVTDTHLKGVTHHTAYTFATLDALTDVAGMRSFMTDGSVVHAGNEGSAAAGGGANFVPVYNDGSSWIIG